MTIAAIMLWTSSSLCIPSSFHHSVSKKMAIICEEMRQLDSSIAFSIFE